jgi:hypothetical protein
MTEEDEEFERIAVKCKETQRVNESKWRSEMCSNYGGFCKKEWVGLTDDEVAQAMYRADAIFTGPMQFKFAQEIEAKLKDKNHEAMGRF